jgi:hypothetical protein
MRPCLRRGRYPFIQKAFAGAHGKWQDAPIPVVRVSEG